MKNRSSYFAHALLLLAVVAYAVIIQWLFGWQKMLAAWQHIPGWYPAAALLLMFFTYVIRGWRIYDFFLPMTRGGLLLCCKIMLSHNLLNNLLPMRTGEASFPLLMRSYFAASISYSTAGLVLLRLLDLQVLLCIGFLTVLGFKHSLTPFWWAVFILLVISPLLLLPLTPLLARLAQRIRQPKISHMLQQVVAAMPPHLPALLRSWLLTWICWVLKILVFALVLRWFATVDWWRAIGVCIGGELSSVLPIHAPAGLGTYEASMLAAAKLMGLAGGEGQWILFAGVQLHMLMIISTLIGGLVAFFIPGGHKAHAESQAIESD